MESNNDIAGDDLGRMTRYKTDLLDLLNSVMKYTGSGREETECAISCEQYFDDLIFKYCGKIEASAGISEPLPMSGRYAEWLRQQRMKAQAHNED